MGVSTNDEDEMTLPEAIPVHSKKFQKRLAAAREWAASFADIDTVHAHRRRKSSTSAIKKDVLVWGVRSVQGFERVQEFPNGEAQDMCWVHPPNGRRFVCTKLSGGGWVELPTTSREEEMEARERARTASPPVPKDDRFTKLKRAEERKLEYHPGMTDEDFARGWQIWEEENQDEA